MCPGLEFHFAPTYQKVGEHLIKQFVILKVVKEKHFSCPLRRRKNFCSLLLDSDCRNFSFASSRSSSRQNVTKIGGGGGGEVFSSFQSSTHTSPPPFTSPSPPTPLHPLHPPTPPKAKSLTQQEFRVSTVKKFSSLPSPLLLLLSLHTLMLRRSRREARMKRELGWMDGGRSHSTAISCACLLFSCLLLLPYI